MVSIRSFTDKELLNHITVNQELLESSDYGTADYNSADSELRVAKSEQMRREIATAEAKDELVLEYLNLSMEFTEFKTKRSRQTEIKVRLNEIRSALKLNHSCDCKDIIPITSQQELLSDLRMEQREAM